MKDGPCSKHGRTVHDELVDGESSVIGGELHLQEADAVITPANNRLSGREGLDAQIHKAAGDELRDFCTEVRVEQRKLNLPPCPVTTNVVSSSFNLKSASSTLYT